MKNGKKLKEIVLSVIFVSVLIVSTIAHIQVTYAETVDDAFERPVLMRVTNYYSNSGHCADGTVPKPNYSCGARRDLIGCVAMVYEQDSDGSIGDFIGYYEVHDTGSAKRIQSGMSIDIYQTTLDECWAFTHRFGDYLFVQYVRGEG